LSLQNLEEKEVHESPVRGRESGSRNDAMDVLGNRRQSEETSSPDPRASSNPYRLVAEQLTEPTVNRLGMGVDPFGADIARDNQRWLGRSRLKELVGRVGRIEEELVGRVSKLEEEFAKLRHGRSWGSRERESRVV
jgi:hypothetical protein